MKHPILDVPNNSIKRIKWLQEDYWIGGECLENPRCHATRFGELCAFLVDDDRCEALDQVGYAPVQKIDTRALDTCMHEFRLWKAERVINVKVF